MAVLPPPPPVAAPSAPPRSAYTSWIRRVLAAVVDGIPVLIVALAGWVVLLATRQTDCYTDPSGYDIGPYCSTGASPAGQIAVPLTAVLAVVFVIWNNGWRQGRTGSSLGKSLLRFSVVGEKAGQPVGFGRSVLRQLAHLIDALLCYVGFLFPLWDSKRQTLADKIMHTVCVPRR